MVGCLLAFKAVTHVTYVADQVEWLKEGRKLGRPGVGMWVYISDKPPGDSDIAGPLTMLWGDEILK